MAINRFFDQRSYMTAFCQKLTAGSLHYSTKLINEAAWHIIHYEDVKELANEENDADNAAKYLSALKILEIGKNTTFIFQI